MNEKIFEAALGIVDPLFIEKVEFSNDELHVYVNFYKGSKFGCPSCGAELTAYDTTDQAWRHMNFFQYKCILHFPVPRVKCPSCGVRKIKAPWASGANGFTELFTAFILELVKSNVPVSKIAEMFQIDDMKIWRIIRKYVRESYSGLVFADVKQIGIDDTSIAKGQRYITIFADAETRKVLFCVEGRDHETVKQFAEEFQKHGGKVENISDVAQDLSAAYAKGVRENLPNATITFDKFHVEKLLNEAVDSVRRGETKQHPELKRSRYSWLKNPGNLTPEQLSKRDELLDSEFLKTAEIYRQKLTLQSLYDNSRSRDEADFLLSGWLNGAKNSGIYQLVKYAKTVETHLDGILRYFETGLTSGFMESINSRIQQIKRVAKGFRNVDNFIAMAYLKLSPIAAAPTHSF